MIPAELLRKSAMAAGTYPRGNFVVCRRAGLVATLRTRKPQRFMASFIRGLAAETVQFPDARDDSRNTLPIHHFHPKTQSDKHHGRWAIKSFPLYRL